MTMRDDAARACTRRGSTARENAASVLSNEWVNDEYKHLRVRVDALAAQVKPGHRHILVVGRGVGLATLAPLAEHAATHDVQVTALLSARAPEHLMSQQRFLASGANVIEVTDSDGSSAMAQVEHVLLLRSPHAQ